MSYIHFKFVYKTAFDKVTFDGVNLTLSQLKKLIVEKSKLTQNKQLDYDLEITNVDTNEVYRNETDLINKNSRVNVKRIMRSSTAPLRAQPPKITTTTQSPPVQASITVNTSNSTAAESAAISFSNTINSTQQSQQQQQQPITLSNVVSRLEHDSLAPLNFPSKPIVYMQENLTSNPSTTSTDQSSNDESRQDEKAKLESILFSTMNAAGYSSNNSQTMKSDNNAALQQHLRAANSWQPRMPNMINSQIRPQQPQQLRPSYCCTICKKPGHPKSLCPEAGTLPKPEERPKFPSGIPKNKMRVARPDDKFAMLGPDGYVVPEIEYQVAQTVKKDKTPFLTEEEEEEEKKKQLESIANGTNGSESLNKYPPELKCPFGDHIIKDAVLVPCCGHFICCDECVKKKILNDEYVECPHKDCDQEIGSLESITPYHDIRKRVTEYLNDLKLASQRATNIQSANAQSNNTKSGQSSNSTNAFLDLLLSEVKNENSNQNGSNFDYDDFNENKLPKIEDDDEDKLSYGTHSPLQDSKISSSEAAAALMKAESELKNIEKKEQSLNEMKPIDFSAPLLPTPPLSTLIEGKPIQQQNQLSAIPASIPNPNMRPMPLNPNFKIQNEIPNIQIQQVPPSNPYMIQQRPQMIPPKGNFPPSVPPPIQYQQYPNNFNPNFNPKYMNNPNNIRNSMPPIQNGPPYHQQQRTMMMPSPQQYMNNPMQQPPNMMMNRQQPLQYPGQGPSYPHHMPQNNFNNGMIGGPPQYNVPPGVMPHPPPGMVNNFINNKPGMIGNMPPFNAIPSQHPLIPGQQMAPTSGILPNLAMLPPNPGVPMSKAEFENLKERLKKEEIEKLKRSNRRAMYSRSRSRTRSYSNSSYSSSSSRSRSSRSRSNSRRRSKRRSRSTSRNRSKYVSMSSSSYHSTSHPISQSSNYRSTKNKRDYYRRRSNSRENRRSKSRSKNTGTNKTSSNKDYYHYKQNNSRSRSRSPVNRYSKRSSRSRSSSPSSSRYRGSKSSRNNSSPYRRPTDSKSAQLPQVIASSINKPNPSDNTSIENLSSSSGESRQKTDHDTEKKKITSSVVIKREDNENADIAGKKSHQSKDSLPKNDKKSANSVFSATKIDAACHRTVISRISKQLEMEKEGSVLSSVSSDSNKETFKKEETVSSKHKHKSKKKSKHKHRSHSRSSNKIQV